MENISIVGTGLIGSSIALGVKSIANNIVGFDTNLQNIEYAIETGIINESWSVEKIAFDSDLIIVAVPVDIAITLIPYILNKVKDDATVIDVGSTKASICEAIKNHPKRKNFIATHPMAGSAVGGPQGADEKLFQGRKVIFCETERSSQLAVNRAMELFNILGMSIEYMDVETHDNTVALVSHLPQIVSYGITSTVANTMNTNQQWFKLASSGFDSSTRLAKSSSDVWTPILIQNKENISKYLQLFIDQIETIKGLIESGDSESISQLIYLSQSVREKFENNQNKKKDGNKTTTRISTTKVVASGVE